MARHHPKSAVRARWPHRVADSGRAGGETPPGFEEFDLATASNDLIPLYQVLIEADERADAVTLARLGWILFALASKAQQAQHDALVLLMELRAAAGAVSAGEGNRASLELLRHVLSKHGWLPSPGATPLQVLATSYPPVSSRISELDASSDARWLGINNKPSLAISDCV